MVKAILVSLAGPAVGHWAGRQQAGRGPVLNHLDPAVISCTECVQGKQTAMALCVGGGKHAL
jgi:hypothetical protein